MSLRLVIEHSPHQQPVTEVLHRDGDLCIGRGAEADWRIEDPDMFVSRRHCLIAGDEEGFTVTDMSRGGLFVDGADTPLGAGRSCPLQDGMRLRLGDVVVRVELRSDASVAGRAAGQGQTGPGLFVDDDFFSRRSTAEPESPRPPDLPDPFDRDRERARGGAAPEARRRSPDPDDFTLEAVPGPRQDGHIRAREIVSDDGDDRAGFAFPSEARAHPPHEPDDRPPSRGRATPGPAAEPPPTPAAEAASDLVEALLRGMGLDAAEAARIGPADMEVLGRRVRALVGVVDQSLRNRAREKRNLRVAQTVIGSSNVNPLKFLPVPEDMLLALIGPARPGYMDADEAIAAAARDLADHQLRSWSGLQAALRRMIERFDPDLIEREMEAAGRLRAILAGGRSALLWQLYCERFASIARSAEERFLGDVGQDFRDAYEGQGRTDDD
ncbi:type VI secretion system-associated FHA domain protein TagH [Rubellimicrobium arenae]|uniref:type VI secretion system-associated FHA domain protein TagH n=1 Tax=Rubellimicrobium arenae TaxID=2817372 RepID=UPI001B317845|nr:type VI secretion system-associated FHA domain protein TagH [Rubellimicrobium arenae]